MGIERDQVRRIAMLSRITVADDELDLLSEQLSRILDDFDKLKQLDTSDVAPLSHALPVANVFRDDEPGRSLPPEAALANAPEKSGTSFRVPRVLDEGSSA